MPEPTFEAVTLPTAAEVPHLTRGQVIGRYVVLEQLGAGGMGVVYAAYDPSLDRKVALKLVRTNSSLPDADLQARLLHEARALARLSHPNVVAVHDAGSHEGQVFLAMEHVPGVTLTSWLEQPRTWEQVVSVFLEAGQGLAAAHRASLVHRDFKPDNVLVDASGRARVTDFGLARAVDDSRPQQASTGGAAASPILSGRGALIGTPAYMAPEQFAGFPADERSDQFSFCVALYEALWGRRPYAGESVAEVQTAIAEGRFDPPPPSKVPGRVQNAVLRGLSTDPSARHPSIEALLGELSHRPALTVGRAVIATILIGALASTAFAWRQHVQSRCTGAEAKLTGVWDAARRRTALQAFTSTKAPGADTAARVAFDRLDAWALEWAKGHTEACRATRVTGEQSEALLDRRMRCLSRKLEEVDAQAALFEKATPEIVLRAAQASSALPRLATCGDLDALRFELEPSADPGLAPRIAEQRRALAEVKALRHTGRYVKALERAEQTVAAVSALHVAPLEAEALFRLGDAQELAGQSAAAETSLERAVFAAEAAGHEELVAEASVRLVLVAGARRGRYEVAALWERHALAAIARLGGREELEGDLNDYLASGLTARGLDTDALQRHQQALLLRERALGPDHPSVAASLNNTANVLMALGRLDESELTYRRAITVYERALGPEHPRVAMAHDNLAALFEERGDIAKLTESAQRGLALRERLLPPQHPELALSLIHVAVAQSARGEHEAAIAGTERALGILSGPGGPGPSHPLTIEATVYAADALVEGGRFAAALERYDALLGRLGDAEVPPSITLRCEVGAARALVALGRLPEAMARLESALERDAAQPPSTPHARGALLLGEQLWQRGDRVKARALVDKARADCVKAGSHAQVLTAIDGALARMKAATP
ncbi:MAG: tetratricopeptide repeat protein [Myxococcales bacterium]|nr:tetratricopeptide repeat protein [Myxococcales bacterium]